MFYVCVLQQQFDVRYVGALESKGGEHAVHTF